MKTPDSTPSAGDYESKENLEPRVAAFWHRATDEYYQALSKGHKVGDVRPLDTVLEKHREEVIRRVSESLSKMLKKFVTDENIVSELIHEMQYNKTIEKETAHIWKL